MERLRLYEIKFENGTYKCIELVQEGVIDPIWKLTEVFDSGTTLDQKEKFFKIIFSAQDIRNALKKYYYPNKVKVKGRLEIVDNAHLGKKLKKKN